MISPDPLISPFGEVLNIAKEFRVDPEVLEKMRERNEQRRLQEEAERRMAEAQEHPEDQTYLFRLDKKRIVQTESEYAYCVGHNVPMKTVGYRHALKILDEMQADRKKQIKKRHTRKSVKSARKRNR